MSAGVAEKLRDIASRILVDVVEADSVSVALAKVCLEQIGGDSLGKQTIARWAGAWWQWRLGHHRRLDDEEVRSMVWGVLCRVDIEQWDAKSKKRKRRKCNPTRHDVSSVVDAMIAVCDRIPNGAEVPFALPGYAGPDPRYLAIVRNGLLEPANGNLHVPSPRLFATAGAAVDYDPKALCPEWEKFLVSIFTDEDGKTDSETIKLVRQIFGWLISGDTTRHVIPLVIGPPRSGKSTMMAIMRALLGEGNVCAPPLSSLAESRFGLAPLVGKSAAIIPDARLGNRADQNAVAGLLLMVSGRDTVEIDRKGQAAISVRLGCRIIIVSNELPRITDASGALASRYRVVETRRSFLGGEDRGLEERLRGELPGIMRWSLLGWRDLEANGWIKPKRTEDVLDELARLGSPTKAFIHDRLVVTPGAETAIEVIYREWQKWCEANGRKEPGTVQTFGRDMRAAVPPGVKIARPRSEGDDGKERRGTVYIGLGMREMP